MTVKVTLQVLYKYMLKYYISIESDESQNIYCGLVLYPIPCECLGPAQWTRQKGLHPDASNLEMKHFIKQANKQKFQICAFQISMMCN